MRDLESEEVLDWYDTKLFVGSGPCVVVRFGGLS